MLAAQAARRTPQKRKGAPAEGAAIRVSGGDLRDKFGPAGMGADTLAADQWVQVSGLLALAAAASYTSHHGPYKKPVPGFWSLIDTVGGQPVVGTDDGVCCTLSQFNRAHGTWAGGGRQDQLPAHATLPKLLRNMDASRIGSAVFHVPRGWPTPGAAECGVGSPPPTPPAAGRAYATTPPHPQAMWLNPPREMERAGDSL